MKSLSSRHPAKSVASSFRIQRLMTPTRAETRSPSRRLYPNYPGLRSSREPPRSGEKGWRPDQPRSPCGPAVRAGRFEPARSCQLRPTDHRQRFAPRDAPTQVPDEPLATDERVSDGGNRSERRVMMDMAHSITGTEKRGCYGMSGVALGCRGGAAIACAPQDVRWPSERRWGMLCR